MNEGQISGAGNMTPQLMQQPVQQPMQQPVITSGTGDIILGGGEEKKSRKGLIIIVVLLMVLALVGGGILLWQSGVTGGGDGVERQSQVSNLKEAFNSYVNYVMKGEESISDVGKETIPGGAYYKTLPNDERESYLERADNKYNTLVNMYNENEGEVSLEPLKDFFQETARIIPLTKEDITTYYLANDEEVTTSYIEDYYYVFGATNNLNVFLNAEIELSKNFLNIIVSEDRVGCIKDGKEVEGCYTLDKNEWNNLDNANMAVMNSWSVMSVEANNLLISLYQEIYGVDLLVEEATV